MKRLILSIVAVAALAACSLPGTPIHRGGISPGGQACADKIEQAMTAPADQTVVGAFDCLNPDFAHRNLVKSDGDFHNWVWNAFGIPIVLDKTGGQHPTTRLTDVGGSSVPLIEAPFLYAVHIV